MATVGQSTPYSLQRRLLLGVGLSLLLFVLLHAALVYRETLSVLHTAYDRSLLASAKTIGESLELVGKGAEARVVATVPYSALEAFEADSRSRMIYRVTGLNGELVSGYPDLNPTPTSDAETGPYAALVTFFDAMQDEKPVRVARLAQPLANSFTQGMATVEVVETMDLRYQLARQTLFTMLLHHLALLAVLAVVVGAVIRRSTRGVRRISADIEARSEQDFRPIDLSPAPSELRPALEATNRVMARLQAVADDQKRFVRDASHQLRTPLAVLKTQVQSALRGDVSARQGLVEISGTIDRATNVANQMLALAKVEQLRLSAQAQGTPVQLLDEVVRDLCLEMAPLIVERRLDLNVQAEPSRVKAHEWMLRELTRNLLANAIRYCPVGGPLEVSVQSDPRHAVLRITDSGPGIAAAQRERLFLPFSAAQSGFAQATASAHSGAGLGLVICKDICDALDASLSLDDNPDGPGTVAIVRMAVA